MKYIYRIKYTKHNTELTMRFVVSKKYTKEQAISFAKEMSNTIDSSCTFTYVAIIDENFNVIEVL